MNVDHFSNYFNNAPVLYIEGRMHSVKVLVLLFAYFYLRIKNLVDAFIYFTGILHEHGK